jgi:hypothetical protein
MATMPQKHALPNDAFINDAGNSVNDDKSVIFTNALYDTLFPFTINPKPSKREFWSITLSRAPAQALAFSLAIAALYIFISCRHKIGWKSSAFDFILIALFGIYALIAIILEGFGSKYIRQT